MTHLRRLARLAVLLLAFAAPARAASPDARIADWAWDRTAAGGTAPVLVMLRDRADLSAAATLPDVADRRRFVWLALRATADRSQAALRAHLDARGVAHRDFFIVNAVRVEADRALLLDLARRTDVDRIVGDPRLELQLPPSGPAPKAVQWDIALIGAPDVWAEGFTGQGIVVGIQDTGIRGTHQAIRTKYRGWDPGSGTASHDYNWRDTVHAGGNGGACGTDSLVPCDDHGHGTHVTGTVAGGDPAGDAMGVAPGAQWIGCRNMDQGWGSPSTYLECFEFFLAPTPVGGTPDTGDPLLAPDLTSNSWACPPSEGCSWDVLQPAVEAQRAAGIMTVVAAGNSGSSCGSITDPPALYDAAYTVGASDVNDAMAGFSSRGPVTVNGLMKPDIVAPGVGIRSATASADDSYASWSGTSMATPHVAGAVALLWSARPAYRGRIAETEELLNRTALRLSSIQQGCGGDDVNGPNATWGHGRLDIARAVREACAPLETACADAFDEDCDGLVDCADADCAGDAACPEPGNCADGVDNDFDERADCADDECAGDPACPEAGNCADGVDNDIDAGTDCADPDCAGDAGCPEEGNCTDGVDNDLDGAVDCADAECAGDPGCPEAGHCTDRVDNDLDGRADCDDDDCSGDAACPEIGHCTDGVDNDLDGVADCADPECSGDAACPENGRCADGMDNDVDGALDCADADCAGDAACPEGGNCADGIDNDLDGDADCLDADCGGDPACPEAGHCADGVDQDLDGRADCADADCAGDAACPEGGNCADGIDNDLDGFLDCLDDDCVGSGDCPESAACANARDDDGDGLTDCADADCAGDAACPETGNCADGVDNDLDARADCDDAECVSDASCAGADLDGDGVANGTDCAPLDAGAHGLPPEVRGLVVARSGSGAVVLAWDVATTAGTGVTHDVASGTLPGLRAGGASGTCLAQGEPAGAWEDARPATPSGDWYLVRASTACGPSPAGWGTDSAGVSRPDCP